MMKNSSLLMLILCVLIIVCQRIFALPLRQGVIDCKTTELGESYQGQYNVTKSGVPCVRWDEVTGTFQSYITYVFRTMPDKDATNAQNYCRNPNKDKRGLWCFISDKGTVAFCDVPTCPKMPSTTTSTTLRTRKPAIQTLDSKSNLQYAIQADQPKKQPSRKVDLSPEAQSSRHSIISLALLWLRFL